jgi:uncharacterized membrane protein YhdT
MSVNYQGRITASDLRRAMFLNYPVYVKWINGILIAFILLAVLYAALTGSLSGTIGLGAFFGVAVLAMPFFQPFLDAQAVHRKGSIYYNPIQGTIDEGGLSLDNGQVKTDFLWDDYTSFREAPGIVLLYKGRNCVNILTRALFASQEDWDTFTALVREKVAGRNSRA